MPSLAHKLRLQYRSIDDLKTNPRNARTHSAKQVAQIAASIRQFGFTGALLVDEDLELIAGHGRLAAAMSLGMPEVPVFQISHLTPMQKRALMLSDNKLALNAGWDEDRLRIELSELSVADLDFDLGITGFETAEIDLVIGAAQPKADPADEQVDPADVRAVVSSEGDLWLLGQHRLLCGNALEPESYAALLGDERAQMVLSDLPYNVPIAGNVSGRGATKHSEFAMASGEMSEAEFTAFLGTAIGEMARVSVDGAILELFMDWRHIGELLDVARPVLGKPLQLCVWNKSNGGMGSLYRSKHELVLVFKKGKRPHINNIELGRHGRYRTNVWDYPGASSFGRNRGQDLQDHPTVKPTALIADAILDCSKRGGIILDPFGGSGTLILAAERTGRRARVMELDPRFVDVAIQRWLRLGLPEPTLAETGESFAAVAEQRGGAGKKTRTRRRNGRSSR